jgi:HAMP domain-containing protein
VLAAFRKHITARLAAIWLVVAIPLLVILALTFLEWYQARLAIILQERQGYALSAATSFDLLLTQMRLTMRVSGGEIADAVSSGADATPALRRLASLYPAAYAAFADERGAIVASSEASSVGSSLRSDAAFQQALKSGDGGGLEPSEVARDGTVGFHVAQMIPARPGRPAGIVLLLVDVRRLHAGFPVTVPSGGVSIVDSAGQVVFQNEVPRFAEERSPWGAMFPFVREALRGRAATTRDFHFPLGGTRLAVFVPISRIEWAAGSSISPAVALAPFYRTLAIVFPIGAVVLSLALFSSLLLSRGIHRSLDGLATDARRIGSGDLTEAVQTERSDEIGDVGRSLEAARQELKAAREQAVRELESTQVLLRAADALAAPARGRRPAPRRRPGARRAPAGAPRRAPIARGARPARQTPAASAIRRTV